jgi:hypothetical protein
MKTKLLSIAAAAGLLIGSSALVQAQSGSRNGGMSGGPGASATSPGHEMQKHGSKGGPGASGFAPGHQRDRDDTAGRGDRDDRTTGFGGRDDDDRMRHDVDGRMMDDDRRGIDKE